MAARHYLAATGARFALVIGGREDDGRHRHAGGRQPARRQLPARGERHHRRLRGRVRPHRPRPISSDTETSPTRWPRIRRQEPQEWSRQSLRPAEERPRLRVLPHGERKRTPSSRPPLRRTDCSPPCRTAPQPLVLRNDDVGARPAQGRQGAGLRPHQRPSCRCRPAT